MYEKVAQNMNFLATSVREICVPQQDVGPTIYIAVRPKGAVEHLVMHGL